MQAECLLVTQLPAPEVWSHQLRPLRQARCWQVGVNSAKHSMLHSQGLLHKHDLPTLHEWHKQMCLIIMYETVKGLVPAMPADIECFKSVLASVKCQQTTTTTVHPSPLHQFQIYGCYLLVTYNDIYYICYTGYMLTSNFWYFTN